MCHFLICHSSREMLAQLRKAYPDCDADEAEALLGFFDLKHRLRDWDALMTAPSPRVDKLWRNFLLRSRAYAEFCSAFGPGVFFHYRPEAESELTHETRYAATRWWMSQTHAAFAPFFWPEKKKDAWWEQELEESLSLEPEEEEDDSLTPTLKRHREGESPEV